MPPFVIGRVTDNEPMDGPSVGDGMGPFDHRSGACVRASDKTGHMVTVKGKYSVFPLSRVNRASGLPYNRTVSVEMTEQGFQDGRTRREVRFRRAWGVRVLARPRVVAGRSE